ncbi:MAG: DEAD/DEAH box helicase [Candidatus Lokiarchaeota archaeon]|nr:DEAD/DEAH box helicase [Candidatus Lokiarchaeota archaeon]
MLEPFLQSLKATGAKVRRSVVYDHAMPAKDPVFGEVAAGTLHPALEKYVRDHGLSFYSHQASAIGHASLGKNVIVATSTASGKSVCYLFPIVDALLKSAARASALLVFPLKALAQDQHVKVCSLLEAVGLPKEIVGVYDADASVEEKRRIRSRCKIIITNPYGMHQYLGNLRLWKEFFEHIAFVVFDEVHVYSGVFGSNVAFLMRRLQRAAMAFKRIPQWIFCSATIGNPLELAMKLTGLGFELVDNDGSGNAGKKVWFWNPMFVDGLGKRLSIHQDTRALFKTFTINSFQTLVFTQSRKMAELQAKWAKDGLAGSPLADRVMSYRAGYPPKVRRALERKLRDKELVGVAATSALELGIDVGSLDVVIISGFPGSITSFWQQAGRCGRSSSESLVVFLAGSDALDQYYINNPGYFFAKTHEDAIIDLCNPYIVKGQLECGIKEIPLHEMDMSFFGPRAREIVEQLVAEGAVHKVGGRYVYTRGDFPAERTSLNSIPSENFKVFEAVGGKKRLLTSETESRVFSTLHEGAIFLFMAETYKVEKLDMQGREVSLRREDVDYYTQALYETSIFPISVLKDGFEPVTDANSTKPTWVFPRGTGLEGLDVYYGDVRVEHEYTRYAVKSIDSGEAIDYHPLELPKTAFNTKAMWFNVPLDVQVALDVMGKRSLGGGIHAVEHGSIGLFPKNVLCSRWDVGGVSIDVDPLYKKPMIYIYDAFPGGIGLAEKAKDNVIQLLEDTLALIRSCPCKGDAGCPSCIQSPKCGNGNEPLSKKAAVTILSMVLDGIGT